MPERSTIGVEAAVDALVTTADFFRAAYKQLVEEWSPDAPPVTIIFSSLGRSFCSHSSMSSKLALMNICAVIEELMSRGDDAVQDAVATGMLEAMLAESSAGRFDMSTLTPFLGTHTKAYCRAWDEFTGIHTPGLYDD